MLWIPVRGARATTLLFFLTTLLSGCGMLGPAPAPSNQVQSPQQPPSELVAPRNLATFDTLGLLAYAASLQGKPYRTAGASPNEGFDCSGLVQHVFALFDLALPRNAESMANALPTVSLATIEAADLLFFNTQGRPYSHVGIYLGEGRFVHAPSPQTGRVIISSMRNSYWSRRLTGARRPQRLAVAVRED